MSIIQSRMSGESDDWTLALTMDGGGLRGVVSGAMVIALRDLGALDVFDRIYVNSAASINLAYVANGNDWDALSMYYDYLPENFFRKAGNFLAGPALNMDYLEHLFAVAFPLRRENIARSGHDIRVLLADVDATNTIQTNILDPRFDLVQLLQASAWLPLLAGAPIVLNGTRYLDGGILMPHPVFAAIDDHATHVVALSPFDEQLPSGASRQSRRLLAGVLNSWQPGMGRAYLKSRVRWDSARARLAVGDEGSIEGAKVIRLAPAHKSHLVSRLTKDRELLLDGARVGYEYMMQSISGSERGRSYFAITPPQKARNREGQQARE